MYLWHILSRPNNEMIYRCYLAQKLSPAKNDYFLMISKEREKYGIELSDSEIQNMSKTKFRKIVYESVERYAISNLISTAKTQSKCQSLLKNISEKNFQIQKYLISDGLTKEEQLLLFSLRSFTFPVKTNFKYLFDNNMKCRGCQDPLSIENVEHISKSCRIFKNERHNDVIDFENVFGPLDDQIRFVKKFKVIARKWKLILEINEKTM